MAGPLAFADVNHDGRLDLLVPCADPADGEKGLLTVYIGDGGGRFSGQPKRVPVPFPGEALWLATGDVNQDGHADAVVGHHDRYDLALLLGDGKGGFAPGPQPLVTTHDGPNPHTHSLALADVNGDSHLDVLTTCAADNAVAVLLGDGDGRFTRMPGSPFPAGRQPYEGLTAALVNSDAFPDIVVPNLWGSAVSVLLGDGTGRFRPAPDSPFAVAARPGFVAVGDLNGDKLPDIVVTHDDDPIVDILLGDGKGGMTLAQDSPRRTAQPVWEAVIADLDSDGRNDIVLGGSRDQIIVLFGDGRGGVRGSPHVIRTQRRSPGRVQVADLNRDEKPDLVITYFESDVIDVALSRSE